MKIVLVSTLALALVACGQGKEESEPAAESSAAPAPAPVAPSGAADAAAAAPAAFAQCRTCHPVEPGATGIGPSLAGVFGAKSGHVAGYPYSEAMRKAGLTWDAAALDRFLVDPRGTVPGTKMMFAGVRDPAARKAIIDFLGTI